MDKYTKDFKIEVESQNALKAFAKKAIVVAIAALKPYEGKKIFTMSGDKVKGFELNFEEVKKNLPLIEGSTHATVQNCYLSAKHNTIRLNISLCFNMVGIAKYVDTNYDLATSADNQKVDKLFTIEKVTERAGLDKVHDFDAMLKKVIKIKELEKQISDIRSTIGINSNAYKYV